MTESLYLRTILSSSGACVQTTPRYHADADSDVARVTTDYGVSIVFPAGVVADHRQEEMHKQLCDEFEKRGFTLDASSTAITLGFHHIYFVNSNEEDVRSALADITGRDPSEINTHTPDNPLPIPREPVIQGQLTAKAQEQIDVIIGR